MPTIAHIGLGNFCRAHFARYMEDYNNLENGETWNICAIDRNTKRTEDLKKYFQESNFSYNLTTTDKKATRTKKIKSIKKLINMGVCPAEALECLVDSETKLVSMTVTEKGYSCDLATGKLIMNSELEHDLTPDGRGKPKSMLGLVVEALSMRMKASTSPFTLMSLDNICGNGHILEKAVLEFAGKRNDEALVNWIKENCKFPCTMVDRITPNTVEASDAVICEPFRQWVIEDNFCNERPEWEKLSGPKLVLTEDVLPYELIKVRLLNGAHSALAYGSYLKGHRNVDVAMSDEKVCNFVKAYMQETKVTVKEAPGMELDSYTSLLIERFSNPNVSDKVARLCEDGSMKASSFWKPIIVDHLKNDQQFPIMAISVATWIVYSVGKDESGIEHEIKDPALGEVLKPLAQMAVQNDDITPFLKAAFGSELAENKSFADQVLSWLKKIKEESGITAFFSSSTLEALIC